jgi:hypothetical protein
LSVFVVPGGSRPVVLSFVTLGFVVAAIFVSASDAIDAADAGALVPFAGAAAAAPTGVPRRHTSATDVRNAKALLFVAIFFLPRMSASADAGAGQN